MAAPCVRAAPAHPRRAGQGIAQRRPRPVPQQLGQLGDGHRARARPQDRGGPRAHGARGHQHAAVDEPHAAHALQVSGHHVPPDAQHRREIGDGCRGGAVGKLGEGGVHPLVGAVDHQPPARRQRPVRGQVGEGAQARDAGERLRRGEGGVRALELVEGAADGTQAHQIGAEGTLQLAHPLAGDAHRGAHAVEGPAAEDALAVHEGGPGIAGHEQPDVAVGGGENRGGRVKAGVGGAGCAARCRVHVITPEWGTVGQATR